MYNKVIMVGNLTRDIELKYTPSSVAIGSTGIATNRRWKTQNGEQKEEVCFVDITFFGKTAEIANQYLKKGSKVLIEGRLKLDQWTDQNGQKRSKHSIIVESMQMLDTRSSDNQNNTNTSNQSYSGGANQQSNVTQDPAPVPDIAIDDNEIPF